MLLLSFCLYGGKFCMNMGNFPGKPEGNKNFILAALVTMITAQLPKLPYPCRLCQSSLFTSTVPFLYPNPKSFS